MYACIPEIGADFSRGCAHLELSKLPDVKEHIPCPHSNLTSIATHMGRFPALLPERKSAHPLS
jgi:hypothetical protein